MTTRLVLVAVFRRKTLYFGDENQTRHHFGVRNTIFWRRESNSSPF
ncbi:hypothetical protein NSQ96_04910 [Caldifermentibacillus hisashii]